MTRSLTKSEFIGFTLSLEDKKKITAAAKEFGVSVSLLVRSIIFKGLDNTNEITIERKKD